MTPMDSLVGPDAPEVAILDVKERWGCLFVTGKVRLRGEWRDAAFTAYKGDIGHMTRAEFDLFAKRQLPQCIEGVDWQAEAMTA